jgi:UDPglucose 6-dehydrogenase
MGNGRMKVGFIGLGKLGMPCAEVMAEKYDVTGYDIAKVSSIKVSVRHTIKDTVKDRDIIFVAVPTPHDPAYGGSTPIADKEPKDFDYSIVKRALDEIDLHVNKTQLVVLISTVLPGTVRSELVDHIKHARFIYNPYLIAMGSVAWDMVNPECLIIGTEDGTETGDAKILVDFYKPLLENNPEINIGTWDEAEAIKVFYNTFISVKIGLVNMIQDVAEANGNINVDVVTDALKKATQRIVGPKYMTAGMGDGGACHPRDNIALRFLAQKLNLGYDLFHSIMQSRDMQAKKMAERLLELSTEYNLPIVIHGRAYKPGVEYTVGSYSELVAQYAAEELNQVYYVDPLTGDNLPKKNMKAVILLAHNEQVTYAGTGVKATESGYYFKFAKGSIVVDPWRTTKEIPGCAVVHYGNPRKIWSAQSQRKKFLGLF